MRFSSGAIMKKQASKRTSLQSTQWTHKDGVIRFDNLLAKLSNQRSFFIWCTRDSLNRTLYYRDSVQTFLLSIFISFILLGKNNNAAFVFYAIFYYFSNVCFAIYFIILEIFKFFKSRDLSFEEFICQKPFPNISTSKVICPFLAYGISYLKFML